MSSKSELPPLPPFVALLERVITMMAGALTAVAGLGLILMMLQTVADVVSKDLFNLPIRGNIEVVSYYYMTAIVFLPMAITELRFENINVDMVTRHLSRRVQSYLYAVISVISAGFFLLLTWQTYRDAVHATERGEILMGSALISIWPAKWILPLSFLTGAVVFILMAIVAVARPDEFDPSPATDHITVD